MMLLAAGCSSHGRPSGKPSITANPAFVTGSVLRVGYLPGLLDAPALVGLQTGMFGRDLGRARVEPVAFTSVQAEVTSLEDGGLDAAYLDPVAAVAAWQAGRLPVRVVSGVASGGAEFVVGKKITSMRQLAHAQLSAPAGSAQEAALDWWLRQHGLPGLGPGDLGVMRDSALVAGVRVGQIAGGWEPAPLDAELTAAGGRVLVNEAGLWPGGRFANTVLVVTRRLAADDPGAVTRLLEGQLQAEAFITAHASAAEAVVNQQLAATTGSRIAPGVLAASFTQVSFSSDPLAASILTEAQHAAAAGLLKPVRSLSGLFDLAPLNRLLRAAGKPPVRS
jgi:NitT/TauT family transport system substrate-binding protein